MFYLVVFFVSITVCIYLADCVKNIMLKREFFRRREERYVRNQAISEAITEYNKKKASEKIEPVSWKNEGF
jgi:hypothetical protein